MLTYVDFFCGAGGSSSGAAAVPGVRPVLAANHWDKAIASHSKNFPGADHFLGDLHDADVARFPAADLFWASRSARSGPTPGASDVTSTPSPTCSATPSPTRPPTGPGP
ncbi:DNA cytosine methyltransferase [Actinacidiphila glaucinigra]